MSVSGVAGRAELLRRLELDVTRRLDGMLSGDYLTDSTGPGTEAAGSRLYAPGDDARHIDWNLTARSLSPYLRTTEADRELETCVIVDRSPSMDFGTARCDKRELAVAAVAAFGFLTVRSGNRFGVLVAGGDTLAWLAPRTGRAGLLAMLASVYDTPRGDAAPPPAATLAAALTRIERTQHRRGQVVVVSDFLGDDDWPPALRRLCLRQQVIAVQVSDPREFTMPDVGMLSVVDVETGRHLHVHTGSSTLRARYAWAAAQRQRRIERALADAGAEHVRLSTDRDWLVDVVEFIGRRKRRRAPAARVGVARP